MAWMIYKSIHTYLNNSFILSEKWKLTNKIGVHFLVKTFFDDIVTYRNYTDLIVEIRGKIVENEIYVWSFINVTKYAWKKELVLIRGKRRAQKFGKLITN